MELVRAIERLFVGALRAAGPRADRRFAWIELLALAVLCVVPIGAAAGSRERSRLDRWSNDGQATNENGRSHSAPPVDSRFAIRDQG